MRWVTERTIGLPDVSNTGNQNDQFRPSLRNITTAWPQWIQFYDRQRRDQVRSAAGFSVLYYTRTYISYLVELFYVYLLTRDCTGSALQQPTYTLKTSLYNELSSSPDHGSVDMDNIPLSWQWRQYCQFLCNAV